EVPNGRLLRTLQPLAPGIRVYSTIAGHSVLSPDGKFLAAGTIDFSQGQNQVKSELGLWDVGAEKLLHRLRGQGNDMDFPLTFTPDSRAVLTFRNDTVLLIEVVTGKEVRRISIQDRPASAVRFSPCGRLMAFGDAQHWVRVIECATGSPRFQFSGHSVRSLMFSPGSRTLATGGADATIMLWDLRQRWPEAALAPKELEAHWANLTQTDAQQGWQAMRRLADAPRDCVPFLGKQLKPLYGAPPEEAMVKALLTKLDSDS